MLTVHNAVYTFCLTNRSSTAKSLHTSQGRTIRQMLQIFQNIILKLKEIYFEFQILQESSLLYLYPSESIKRFITPSKTQICLNFFLKLN